MKNHIITLLAAILMLAPLAYAESGNGETPPRVHRTSHVKAPEAPLTLEQAINLALQANRGLRSSRYGLESARLSLVSARAEFELKIFPAASAGISGADSDSFKQLGFGLSLEKKFVPGTRASLEPKIRRAGEEHTTDIGVSIEQPLLRGFGRDVNLHAVRSSEFSVRAAERYFYQSQVNTVLETVSAVYRIIEQRELVRLFELLVGRLQGHAEAAKIKEKMGMATPMDVYRAEIRLKDVEDSLAVALDNYQDAKDRLKTILAKPPETSIAVYAPLEFETFRMDLDQVQKIALRNRVELEQLEDDIRETERSAKIAKNNILPELNLVLGYTQYGSSEDFGDSFKLNQQQWGINLVSSTDYARTAERTTYKQSLITVQNARLNLAINRDEIKRQVRSQWLTLKKTEERIRIRKDQIEKAEGKLALAKVKFTHGMADNFDLIEAETELQQASVNLLSVVIQYIVGTCNIRSMMGTLIERKGVSRVFG